MSSSYIIPASNTREQAEQAERDFSATLALQIRLNKEYEQAVNQQYFNQEHGVTSFAPIVNLDTILEDKTKVREKVLDILMREFKVLRDDALQIIQRLDSVPSSGLLEKFLSLALPFKHAIRDARYLSPIVFFQAFVQFESDHKLVSQKGVQDHKEEKESKQSPVNEQSVSVEKVDTDRKRLLKLVRRIESKGPLRKVLQSASGHFKYLVDRSGLPTEDLLQLSDILDGVDYNISIGELSDALRLAKGDLFQREFGDVLIKAIEKEAQRRIDDEQKREEVKQDRPVRRSKKSRVQIQEPPNYDFVMDEKSVEHIRERYPNLLKAYEKTNLTAERLVQSHSPDDHEIVDRVRVLFVAVSEAIFDGQDFDLAFRIATSPEFTTFLGTDLGRAIERAMESSSGGSLRGKSSSRSKKVLKALEDRIEIYSGEIAAGNNSKRLKAELKKLKKLTSDIRKQLK